MSTRISCLRIQLPMHFILLRACTISFEKCKIWMCGGKLVVAPCSHVGHVYRDKAQVPTYVSQSGIKARVRMAEVWLDDYKWAFFNRYARAHTYSVYTCPRARPRKHTRALQACARPRKHTRALQACARARTPAYTPASNYAALTRKY